MRSFLCCIFVVVLSLRAFGANEDERIGELREEAKTLEKVVAETKSTGEHARLDAKLQRVRQELAILEERQAIEAKERSLTEELSKSTADNLREKLRLVDQTVDEGEGRLREITTRRKQIATQRDTLQASLEQTHSTRPADRVAEDRELVYTLGEELRTLAYQRETCEMEIELARDAEALRERLKAFDPNARSSLRVLFETYTRLREQKKTDGQLEATAANLEKNLGVSQSSHELIEQKLAKYDEELVLLEKQTGVFSSDPRVERLLVAQRVEKKALSERLPLVEAQVKALQRTQQALKLRLDLRSLAGRLEEEQYQMLLSGYYRRLRWPAASLGTLLALYVLCAYVLFPISLKNETLLLARRLARYAGVLLGAGAIAGFLFDDLSMVAATLGVVSAALVISLQDVCTSVFGWFVIMLGSKFGIGDRLEVDGARGDVIDIQLLRTTLLEVNGWLGIDQPTGRVITLPNNFIFKTKVFNFSHGHPFIWNKIDLTVTFSTPVATALSLFQRVLEEETREEFAAAQLGALTFRRHYGVEDASYQPKIYTAIADSGVVLSLFFVAHHRSISAVRNRLNRRLIAELENHPRIQLAYNTLSLLQSHATAGAPAAILGGEETRPPFPNTTTLGTSPGLPVSGTIQT